MVGSTCTSASHASRIKMLITRLCSPFSYETLGFDNFKLYESINLKYPPILDPRLKALAAADIELFGLRKKIEKVEEEAVEIVKEGLESSEKGVEAIERGEKEIQSEVSFELGSGRWLMQNCKLVWWLVLR
ncbi:hypothetical protein Tco_0880502 [Tanacetum coccineum]